MQNLINHEASVIGSRLKQERQRLGLSQKECADLAKLEVPYSISSWECGRSYPSVEALFLWGEYGIDIHFLLTGSPYSIENSHENIKQVLVFMQQANKYQLLLINHILQLTKKNLKKWKPLDECLGIQSTVGMRVREERIRFKLNKVQFIQQSLTNYQSVSDWENSVHVPRLKNLLAWHQQTDFDLGYVLTGRKEYPWLSRSARQLIQLWPHMEPVLHRLLNHMATRTLS